MNDRSDSYAYTELTREIGKLETMFCPDETTLAQIRATASMVACFRELAFQLESLNLIAASFVAPRAPVKQSDLKLK